MRAWHGARYSIIHTLIHTAKSSQVLLLLHGAKAAMAWQAYDVPAYGAPRSPTVWTLLLTLILAGTILAFASLLNSP